MWISYHSANRLFSRRIEECLTYLLHNATSDFSNDIKGTGTSTEQIKLRNMNENVRKKRKIEREREKETR
jgi:hypothetical protein